MRTVKKKRRRDIEAAAAAAVALIDDIFISTSPASRFRISGFQDFCTHLAAILGDQGGQPAASASFIFQSHMIDSINKGETVRVQPRARVGRRGLVSRESRKEEVRLAR